MTAVPLIMFSAPRIHEIIREKMEREALNNKADDPKSRGDGGGGGAGATRVHISFQQLVQMYNYNLKFMNSVWGLYNRYAPQSFQKNEESIPKGL